MEPEGLYIAVQSLSGGSAILVLNGTMLNSVNALLALSRSTLFTFLNGSHVLTRGFIAWYKTIISVKKQKLANNIGSRRDSEKLVTILTYVRQYNFHTCTFS